MDDSLAPPAPEAAASPYSFDWLRHLVAALLVAVGLVAVLHRWLLLGEHANAWVLMPLAWAGVIGAGLLFRAIGLRQGVGLALTTGAAFAGLCLLLVWLNLDVSGRTTLAMLVAVPAVVFSSLLGVAVVKWADPKPSAFVGGFALAFAIAFTSMLGPGLAKEISLVEMKFEVADRAEAAGLSPYLIEVDGWEVDLGIVDEETDVNGLSAVVGYSLSFQRDGKFEDRNFSIDVLDQAENTCESSTEVFDHRCEVLRDDVAWLARVSGNIVVADGGVTFTVRNGVEVDLDLDELIDAILANDRVTWHQLATL